MKWTVLLEGRPSSTEGGFIQTEDGNYWKCVRRRVDSPAVAGPFCSRTGDGQSQVSPRFLSSACSCVLPGPVSDCLGSPIINATLLLHNGAL